MAIKIAFDPLLAEIAEEFCRGFAGAFSETPPAFSIALSVVPFPAGEPALLTDAPVLPVHLDRDAALCGPLYVPGKSVCPACVQHWLASNFYDRVEPAAPAREVRIWLARQIADCAVDASMLVALPYDGGRPTRHPVFPCRDCPRCGALSPDATASPHIHCSRWTGILNRMELTADSSAGAFRARALWSAPTPAADARPYLKRQEAYGRGRTREEAELGCIGEALERYSLIYRGDEPMVRARIGELDAIHPDAIQLFSEAQYASRDVWNAAEDEIFRVGEPFDAAATIDWLPARGLGREKAVRYVPAACCLMWYEFRPGEADFGRADSVGCGTGRTFDDAIAHALLEWIERDAMAIWWDNRLRRQAVRPESFESADLDRAVAGLRAIGRELFLLDCTTDIGIPAYISVAPREDGSEPLLGASADLSPRVAAYKAATEAGQIWYAAQRYGGFFPSLNRWLLEESLATQPYLAPSGFVDAPAEPDVPPAEALKHIVARLEACGLSAYAVDLSRSDVLWPAARAIVPGLRHIWNRRAPGRLYDVPVRMGWLASPVAEPDLNPIRCMI